MSLLLTPLPKDELLTRCHAHNTPSFRLLCAPRPPAKKHRSHSLTRPLAPSDWGPAGQSSFCCPSVCAGCLLAAGRVHLVPHSSGIIPRVRMTRHCRTTPEQEPFDRHPLRTGWCRGDDLAVPPKGFKFRSSSTDQQSSAGSHRHPPRRGGWDGRMAGCRVLCPCLNRLAPSKMDDFCPRLGPNRRKTHTISSSLLPLKVCPSPPSR